MKEEERELKREEVFFSQPPIANVISVFLRRAIRSKGGGVGDDRYGQRDATELDLKCEPRTDS